MLSFTGLLYSGEHKQKFKVEDAEIHLYISEDKKRVEFIVDGEQVEDWFKEQFDKLRQNIQPKQERKRSKGFRM